MNRTVKKKPAAAGKPGKPDQSIDTSDFTPTELAEFEAARAEGAELAAERIKDRRLGPFYWQLQLIEHGCWTPDAELTLMFENDPRRKREIVELRIARVRAAKAAYEERRAAWLRGDLLPPDCKPDCK